MRRREFITLLGGAAAWPLAARAQHGERVRRLAVMMGGRNADTDPEGRAWFSAFRQGLEDLGWVEGRNFRADYRWPAGDLDRMRVIAKEFIDLQPDVLVAGNTPAVVSLLQETRKIPIVFTSVRPGRNRCGCEPRASRRQCHRIHSLRIFACRQMAGDTQGHCPRRDASGAVVQSGNLALRQALFELYRDHRTGIQGGGNLRVDS